MPRNSVKEEQTGPTNGSIAGAATAKATFSEASPFSPRYLDKKESLVTLTAIFTDYYVNYNVLAVCQM